MSHFLTIIDLHRKELFCFGKAVQVSYEVFELAWLACQEDLTALLSIFPTEANGWGRPPGAERLLAWMHGQPRENFILQNDSCDPPWYIEGSQESQETRWWPYVGAIWSTTQRDLFDHVGQLVVAPNDVPLLRFSYSALFEESELEKFMKGLRSRGLPKPPGMPHD